MFIKGQISQTYLSSFLFLFRKHEVGKTSVLVTQCWLKTAQLLRANLSESPDPLQLLQTPLTQICYVWSSGVPS